MLPCCMVDMLSIIPAKHQHVTIVTVNMGMLAFSSKPKYIVVAVEYSSISSIKTKKEALFYIKYLTITDLLGTHF